MRLLFLCLFMAVSFIAPAQKSKIAYLPEFKKDDDKRGSTANKILTDILNLNEATIKQEITEKKLRHFSISIIFIIDETGKVITNDIRFKSDLESIKEPSVKYLSELPLFVPKKMSKENNNYVYHISETYLITPGTLTFKETTFEDLKQRNIKPDYLDVDEYPIFPGCGEMTEDNYICVATILQEIFTKNLIIPSSLGAGRTNAHVTFHIKTDGSIEIYKIVSESNDFKKEIRRVFKRVPTVIPAKISGIPITTSFGLPLTLNLE